jgi:hypothetical protein
MGATADDINELADAQAEYDAAVESFNSADAALNAAALDALNELAETWAAGGEAAIDALLGDWEDVGDLVDQIEDMYDSEAAMEDARDAYDGAYNDMMDAYNDLTNAINNMCDDC